MLHRLILAQCSRVLERGMSPEWTGSSAGNSMQQGSLARIREEDEGRQSAGQRPIWRYELDWGGEEGEVPMLVQRVDLTIYGFHDQFANGKLVSFVSASISVSSSTGPQPPTSHLEPPLPLRG